MEIYLMSNSKNSQLKNFILRFSLYDFQYYWRKGFIVGLLVVGVIIAFALIVILVSAFFMLFTGLYDYQNMVQVIIAIPLIIFLFPYYCGCVAEMVENIPYKKKENR